MSIIQLDGVMLRHKDKREFTFIEINHNTWSSDRNCCRMGHILYQEHVFVISK
jgi:hypothetical protein